MRKYVQTGLLKKFLGPSATEIAKLCGSQIPNPIFSSDRFMYLNFVSDSNNNGGGWRATVEFDEVGCGGFLTDRSGTFTTPGHPNNYPHGADCTWYIQGLFAQPQAIKLKLKLFLFHQISSKKNFIIIIFYRESP